MSNDIHPLRKRTKDGVLYTRPPEVENLIVELSRISLSEFVKRAKLKNRHDPDYILSEVLVYRIRLTRHDTSDDQFNALYQLLSERINRSCPIVSRRVGGRTLKDGDLMDLREFVVERIVTLILNDRHNYEERLDMFEVKFDRAVSYLKVTAYRKIFGRQKVLIPLDHDGGGDIPDEIESNVHLPNSSSMTQEEKFTYLFQVRRAIASLPMMERRVMDLLEAGIPIESNNADETSISSVLGCTPKTVRNRRDRAIQAIRNMLGVEVDGAN